MEHAILSNAGVGKRVKERERGKERWERESYIVERGVPNSAYHIKN